MERTSPANPFCPGLHPPPHVHERALLFSGSGNPVARELSIHRSRSLSRVQKRRSVASSLWKRRTPSSAHTVPAEGITWSTSFHVADVRSLALFPHPPPPSFCPLDLVASPDVQHRPVRLAPFAVDTLTSVSPGAGFPTCIDVPIRPPPHRLPRFLGHRAGSNRWSCLGLSACAVRRHASFRPAERRQFPDFEFG